MGALNDSPLAKYVRNVRALPSGIFNRQLFITVIGFALGGCPKGVYHAAKKIPYHDDLY